MSPRHPHCEGPAPLASGQMCRDGCPRSDKLALLLKIMPFPLFFLPSYLGPGLLKARREPLEIRSQGPTSPAPAWCRVPAPASPSLVQSPSARQPRWPSSLCNAPAAQLSPAAPPRPGAQHCDSQSQWETDSRRKSTRQTGWRQSPHPHGRSRQAGPSALVCGTAGRGRPHTPAARAPELPSVTLEENLRFPGPLPLPVPHPPGSV